VSKHFAQGRYLADSAVVSCSNRHTSLGKWLYAASPQLLPKSSAARIRTHDLMSLVNETNRYIAESCLYHWLSVKDCVEILALLPIQLCIIPIDKAPFHLSPATCYLAVRSKNAHCLPPAPQCITLPAAWPTRLTCSKCCPRL